MNGNFPGVGATMLLQIGLICVQSNEQLRPSMSMVVEMLRGNEEIPLPTQPPFLNSSLSPDSYTHSSGNQITESFVESR